MLHWIFMRRISKNIKNWMFQQMIKVVRILNVVSSQNCHDQVVDFTQKSEKDSSHEKPVEHPEKFAYEAQSTTYTHNQLSKRKHHERKKRKKAHYP